MTVGGGGPHPHRVVSSGEEDGRRRISVDSDENKYRRKSPMEMLSRWFKLVNVLLIHSQLLYIAPLFCWYYTNGSLIPGPHPAVVTCKQ